MIKLKNKGDIIQVTHCYTCPFNRNDKELYSGKDYCILDSKLELETKERPGDCPIDSKLIFISAERI